MFLLIVSISKRQIMAFGPLSVVSCSRPVSFYFVAFFIFLNFTLQSGVFKITE